MAQTAENCAAQVRDLARGAGRVRAAQPAAAAKAWTTGRFEDEVAPVEIKTRKGVTVIDQDDHMRPDTTMEGLAKLPAAFSKDGIVTAGNASGIVDGGAALDSRVERGGQGHAALKPLGAHRVLGRRRRRAVATWAWARRRRRARRSSARG